MSKALKATHWHPAPKPALKPAGKRPALRVVKADHPATGSEETVRALQARIQRSLRPRRATPHLRRTVDVLGAGGHLLARYTVALERGCLEAEYEEAALILAEHDGVVSEAEFVHLRARCAP